MTEAEGGAKREWVERTRRWMPALLAAAVVVVYLPSLGGGFLNYDDDWLVEQNPVLRDPSAGALGKVWGDFDQETRLALGAEYLPVRDTFVWLELRAFGANAPPMRVLGLLLFIGAALLVRAYLQQALGAGWAAEAAAWLFALHPVHAESVAWLAGRKDLLALFFVAAALCVHAGTSRRRAVLVPLLFALACLSKAVAVVAPVLLLAHDLLVRRRPEPRVLGPAFAVAALAVALHGWVGHVVGMVAEPLGGGRLAAFVSMGPVWWRYLAHAVAPAGLSVLYDSPARSAADPLGWLAVAALLAPFVLAVLSWRRDDRRPAFVLAWFVVPLLPTSQFLVPLQNAMADRYLLLAVLGPAVAIGLLLAWLAGRGRPGLALGAAVALGGVFGLCTLDRAAAFHDSVSLFRDATVETSTNALPPYQLGMALAAQGDGDGAERALRLAFARLEPTGVRCSAASNLAVRLAEEQRVREGIPLLREARALCPDHPRLLNGLAEFLARDGQAQEARQLYEELVRRFPDYEVGRRNYERRYGPLAGSEP
jgi:tetratricopeptide (TPR) repeat protein